MSDNDSREERRSLRRRSVMGALAAGAGLSSVGGAAEANAQVHSADDWLPPEASEAHVAVLTGLQAGVRTNAGGCVHVTPQEEDTLAVDLVLEDVQCVTQAHVYAGGRGEEGPIVATLVEYTEAPDGSGAGDPLTTDPDTPLVEGTTIDDPELVADVLAAPEEHHVIIHTTHNPDGELRGQIRGFDLGQATEIEPEPASFTVSDLDPLEASVVRGDVIDVSATIRNAGDLTATQTVELRIDGTVVARREVELGCRASTTVTFEDLDTADLEPGVYEHGVFTDDDSQTGTLEILRPPEFVVSDLDPRDVTVTQGDRIDVSATIENVGGATGTQTVEFRIDDDVPAEQELTLDGGESETVTFEEIDTTDLEPGAYEHGVFTDDDSETGTLTVEEPPDPAAFTVSDLDPQEATVVHGDLIDVSATVENVGDETGTQTVEFRIDDDVLAAQELTLDEGQSETVTFEDVDTTDLEPGAYEHGVFTDDDSETGTLTVQEQPDPAAFTVSDLDPLEATVVQGDLIDVSATIENVGGETGTQTVEFRVDDETVAAQELELEAGQSESVLFEAVDTAGLEPGEYELGVFTDDDSETGSLIVEEVEPNDDPDEEPDEEPDDDTDEESDEELDDDPDEESNEELDDDPDEESNDDETP